MTEDQLLDDLIRREGGYSNDPLDRGGPTKFGITAKTLGDWLGLNRWASPEEVQALTIEQAKHIYRVKYISQPGFDEIEPESIRVMVVDTGVNSGPGTALRQLQTALRVSADGRWGPVTRAALAAASPEALLKDLVKLRCLYYARIVQGDHDQARFLAGWLTRALSFL